ncbi:MULTISPECIES: phosphatidylglycerol lysyltransferase domain-containing protein [Psychrilyobacter]|uniref:DUF2156 domain-containing protein n=1 Tax=Psychrilyobacter piezotolerans TaxID=2293438 RepID=A0ABX9KF63_9FUSO|nr:MULTISPECIES: phosphatidylglycerol lysyltransferase domain-containing protein [Psychrilyobacter]MCS5420823.1 phosphatidylglycerol lysyltransferase domain-containing protein [Psychrilyobacter sp. S5]NDI79133.1 bifunctional lysylphosphatidylglycerol flippase/synthetase MprF [Psychrilyobacter piezotolerans]RDE59776.1 DUF2156 domain-containing protein [Psychrilyobacter sp. S5]REI40102.1 DUF2156 domain-containing protein [Psychrilyobacter piezotolerans]
MKTLKAIKYLLLFNVPFVLSILTLFSGSLLLVSGIYPENLIIFNFLFKIFPEEVIFLSKYLINVTSILLIVMSYGLFKKMKRAWFLNNFILVGAILLLLLKGINYLECFILIFVLSLSLLSKDYFYRKGFLLKMNVSKIWLLYFFVLILISTIIGLSIHTDVRYSSSLWWNFSHNHSVFIFLHSILIGSLVILYYLGILFFKPFEVDGCEADIDKEEIKEILSHFNSSRGYFSLLSDKKFLLTDNRDGFIMYGTTKNNYISLGDPICRCEDIPILLDKFNTLGRVNDKNIAFYEIDESYLKYYLNLGLKVIKIGEEAVIDLPSFSLEGSENKKLRYVNSKLSKEGLKFEIFYDLKPVLNELKDISDEWLTTKKTREKEFSLGLFDEDYLKNFPIAVLYYNDEIIAFSNLLPTKDKKEMSIDLMRYSNKAPASTMEFLFIQIILWAQEEGYEKFSLGMAPLSGIETSMYANFWNRYAGFIYENSDTYYNFEGLKKFKNKFFPEWNSKYIAYSGNFNLLRLLLDITSLVSGGVLKVFKK